MRQMEKFRELIDIIQKTPAVQPPEDLTPHVMLSLMQVKTGFFARVWNSIARQRSFSLNPSRALRGESSNNEIYVYFMLAAAAHLVFASVLLIGFQNIVTKTLLPPIILLQPWLLLFLTCWLGFWGLVLKKKSTIGIKMARITMLMYIEVVVINGVLLIIEFKSIFLVMPYIATIVFGTIAAGIFLALICGTYTVRMDNPGNTSPGMKMLV